MADDPYTILSVARDATDKQIRAAFLKIAKKSHPDVNPGDKKAELRFKAAANAHDLLSDPEKRARFDRGEIDGTGQEQITHDRFNNGFPHIAPDPLQRLDLVEHQHQPRVARVLEDKE